MTYLVTGGAGFIGTNFLHYMVNKYNRDFFVCLDKLTYASNINSLNDLFEKENFLFFKGSINDKEAVMKLFQKFNFDYVVNFAAESHVDNSINNPLEFLNTNILGTEVLLEASLKYNVKKFHQVSTDEVYGSVSLDSKVKFTEESRLLPSSPYSVSKASADLLVMSYKKTYGLPVSISRSSNNYGPFQHDEKLIPLMVKKAVNGKNLPVYGNGKNVRDWIYVLDHVKAIELILLSDKTGEIYNVTTKNLFSNLEIVDRILSIITESNSKIEFVTDRKGHDIKYSITNNKIKELGFNYDSSFEATFLKTVLFYKDKFLKEIL